MWFIFIVIYVVKNSLSEAKIDRARCHICNFVNQKMRLKLCHGQRARKRVRGRSENDTHEFNPDTNCSTLYESSFDTAVRAPSSPPSHSEFAIALNQFTSDRNANCNLFILICVTWLIFHFKCEINKRFHGIFEVHSVLLRRSFAYIPWKWQNVKCVHSLRLPSIYRWNGTRNKKRFQSKLKSRLLLHHLAIQSSLFDKHTWERWMGVRGSIQQVVSWF